MQEMLLPNQSAHPSLFRLFPAQTADEIHRLLHRLPLCQVPYIHGSFSGQCRQCLKYQKYKNCIFAHMCSFAHRIFNFLCHLFQFRPGMFPSKHLIPHLNNPVTHMPADFRRLRIRLCGKRKNNHSPYNNQRNTDNSPYTFFFSLLPFNLFFLSQQKLLSVTDYRTSCHNFIFRTAVFVFQFDIRLNAFP